MPDYNPEDVPTLDDIIEKDLADNAESNEAETQSTTNDPDFFSDESIDTDSDGSVSDETEHQSGDLKEDGNEDKSNAAIIDTQPVEPVPQVPVEPISVELMAKNIVNQLIPDLEQKLKFLLQQALEEKQTEETIKSADTTDEN